jgi:uncharacterized protein (TIGR02118 family)
MIKLVFCLRRKPGLSLEEFQRYWLDIHAPLVASHREALGIRRYIQLHSDLGEVSQRMAERRGTPEPYDGIAELWYDSREVIAARATDPAARAAAKALAEDEARFIDHATSPVWIGEEHQIIGP